MIPASTAELRRYVSPLSLGISPTEMLLVDVAQCLGSLADAAHWYSADVAERIDATGKPLKDWTVGELLRLLSQTRPRPEFGR